MWGLTFCILTSSQVMRMLLIHWPHFARSKSRETRVILPMKESRKKANQERWWARGNFLRWWIYFRQRMWWWFHECILTSKLIKLHLYVNYTSIKWFKKRKDVCCRFLKTYSYLYQIKETASFQFLSGISIEFYQIMF